MENAAKLKNIQNEEKKTCPQSQHPTSYVSKIIPTDEKLLRKTVLHIRPRSINYEDSWGYIIQSTRYYGFKWYDPHTDSLIFFGRKSDTDSTLVIPSFFAEPKYLAQVINHVQNTKKAPQTILKNINPQKLTNLIPYGFRKYKKNEGWCKEARFDDQTYPQLVIDLEKVTKKRGQAYKKLRTALNKKPNITIRKYNKFDKKAVLKIFALKDENSKNNLKKSKGAYYASHIMYLTSNLDKFVIIDNETKNIVGFTATSDISSVNTTLVASLFKPGLKVVSVWGIYQTLIKKYLQGFLKINLGGCETIGSYNFMRRTFQPVKKIKKTHLVYKS